MVSIVTPLYQYWTETDGEALEAGKVYVGVLNLDPETNPIPVFWDSALTIPAAQPLRTIGGVFDNNGTPSDAFVDSGFSITVKDANDVVQFIEWDGLDLAGFAELSGAAFTGAVTITSNASDQALCIDGAGDPYMCFNNSGVEVGRISAFPTDFIIKTTNANLTLEAGGVTPDIRFITNNILRAQITDTGNMSIGPAGPSGSALFDLQSVTQGFLPPRMTAAERDAIAAPIAGLVVFNTDTGILNIYDGTTWQEVGGSPVGTITMWPTATAPVGWQICDGTLLNRITQANLFAVLGTTYGVGDGATTFDIPDMRGQFVRGIDNGAGVDPNAGARTDRGDGTTGDFVGTLQDDEFQSHTHGISDDLAGDTGTGNIFRANANSTRVSGSTGGSETRPKNIAMNYIIKL